MPGIPVSRLRLAAGASVFLIAILVFANNWGHGFVFDDGSLVERNERIQSLDGVGSLFTTPYWGKERNDGLYRPLTLLSFALGRAAWGPGPRPHHVVNDVLHALNAVLVFLLAWRVIGSAGAAWCAGILFAVHPIHAEVVNGIVGRAELLSALFVLAALLLALAPRLLDPAEHRARAAGVVLASFLGLLCKENAVVAIPAALAALLLLDPAARPLRAAVGPFVRRQGALLGGAAAAGLVWLAMRWSAVGGGVRPTEFHDNPLVRATTPERLWTVLSLFGLWLRKLLFPHPLHADYSPPRLEVVASPLSPGVLVGAAALLALVFAAWRLRDRRPSLSFWIAFFLLAWLPTSNLPLVIGTLFGERLLYLPSVAFCALLGLGLASLPRRWMTVSALVVLGLAGAGATWSRNADWRSDASLFAEEYRHPPCSARSLVNWANLLEESDPSGALEVYREFLAIAPDYAPGRLALGTFLLKRGDAAAALEHLRRADELQPGNPSTLLNLGSAYAEIGRFAEAAGCFRRIVDADPANRKARLNLERAERLLREGS